MKVFNCVTAFIFLESLWNVKGQRDTSGMSDEDLAAEGLLPPLPNDLCNLDDIYDIIRTTNVHEYELVVRWRECPSNKGSQPCGVALDLNGYEFFNPGPMVDGVRSNTIAVNDDIPGPTIRAGLGDTIRVKVVNLLGEETSMHFHGMTQFRTPFMDGDANINNCPISPGQNHTYEFVAHPAGTTFYHSHEKSQRAAGMWGALIVDDPAERNFPEHMFSFSDWYHEPPDQNFYFWGQNTPGAACITFGGPRFTGPLNPLNVPDFVGAVVGDGKVFNSFIINGHGVYNWSATQIPGEQATGNFSAQTFASMACPGQTENPPQCEQCLDPTDWTSSLCTESSRDVECGSLEVFEVRPQEITRLRLLNAGSLYAGQVCIDGHQIQIIAVDGALVEPYTVDCVILMPGERTDVLVTPTASIGDYWMRITTVEQKVPADFGDESSFGSDTSTFPHQGWAILRIVNSPGEPLPSNHRVRSSKSPLSCSAFFTRNCGPNYWLNSVTMGCAATPSRDEPERCRTVMDLNAGMGSPNDDTNLCHTLGKKMAHEVAPDHRMTVVAGFIPDQVPRWEGNSLNSRLEILREEDWGFPYATPTNPDFWGTHAPVSFVAPEKPVLSLSPEERKLIFDERIIIRDYNPDNAPEMPPNYPYLFSRIQIGAQAVSLQYGDVVRVLLTCAEPYGPGCAMPHPMHLHGHKFAILYTAPYDEPYDESKFNPNPVYRDTVVAQTDGWAVIQFVANNPGVWRFHCHVIIHHRSGMAMLFDTGGGAAVEAVRATPPEYNTCDRYRGGPSSASQMTSVSTFAFVAAVSSVVLSTLCMW